MPPDLFQKQKFVVVMCYAPTEVAEMEVKDSFFDQLQSVIDAQRGGDHIILIGDFNAKVGSDNSGYGQCIGREGCGEMNGNGTRLANFCLDNGLIIGEPGSLTKKFTN